MSVNHSRWIRVFLLVPAAVIACLTLGVVASANTSRHASGASSALKKGGTLKVGILTDILSLDPYSRALQQYTITKVIYESLIEYDSNFKPQPVLATGWSFNHKLTAVTVQLRHGVTFHSGAPFNSEAVVANFQRARNATTGQHMFFFTSVVKDAVATGPYTVRLDLNGATPVPLVLDTLQSLPIVDPGYFTKLSSQASGTGPYELQNWTPGQSITLVPNKNWWGGKAASFVGASGGPYLDGIQMTLFADPSAAIAALESGSIDMIQDVDPNRVSELKGRGFQIVSGAPGALTLEFRLNPQSAPFSSQIYRRGMNYAVDRPGIIKAVRGGYGYPIVTPWYTHDKPREETLLHVYKYDMKKVATAIKQSGVENPGFSIMVNSSFADTIEAAQIVQAAFKQIGVNVTIDQVDSATYTQKLVAGQFQSTITYGSGGQHYPSQVTFGSAWRTTSNALWGNNVPAAYTRAIAADQMALTKAAQEKALHQLENASLVMSSVILIADRPTLFALSSKVHGFATTVDSMPLYGKVWIG